VEAKLKHLEFIQAAIARMSTSSFLFKGWAITIAASLSAFAAVDTKVALIAIALVSTTLFWGLDSYYLWLERGFVRLHTEVAAKTEAEIDFSMKVDKTDAARQWFRTCWRPHLWILYVAIIAVDVVGIFVIRSK
jgi:hypothetical protein